MGSSEKSGRLFMFFATQESHKTSINKIYIPKSMVSHFRFMPLICPTHSSWDTRTVEALTTSNLFAPQSHSKFSCHCVKFIKLADSHGTTQRNQRKRRKLSARKTFYSRQVYSWSMLIPATASSCKAVQWRAQYQVDVYLATRQVLACLWAG